MALAGLAVDGGTSAGRVPLRAQCQLLGGHGQRVGGTCRGGSTRGTPWRSHMECLYVSLSSSSCTIPESPRAGRAELAHLYAIAQEAELSVVAEPNGQDETISS